MVTEYVVVGGRGTWDSPEVSNPGLRGPQSSRMAGWLKKKKREKKTDENCFHHGNWDPRCCPSIAKTYKTDLIHAWLYYHSVSVRSLLSLRPRGHPACVSQLCSSSLTAEQVSAQMDPRRRDNVAKPSENTLRPSRWSDSCDLVCSININRLNHNLHFWAESIQTSSNTDSKCAESRQTIHFGRASAAQLNYFFFHF